MTDVTPPSVTPPKPGVAPPVAPKSGRGLRIALAVSVALNLVIAGAGVGAFLRNHADGGREDMVRELGFGPFTEALGPEDRRALRRSFLAKAPDLRNIKRQRRDDAMAVLTTLRATPFAPDTLTSLMDAQHQRMARQLTLGQEVLRDFLIAMSPEDRAAFAGRLEERLRPRGDDQGHPEKDATPKP